MAKFKDELLEEHDGKYTKNARKAIVLSFKIAEDIGQGYVGTEHLLMAMLQTECVAADILTENGADIDKVLEIYKRLVHFDTIEDADGNDSFSPIARKVLLAAEEEAAVYNYKKVGTEHILLAMIKTTRRITAIVPTCDISLK